MKNAARMMVITATGVSMLCGAAQAQAAKITIGSPLTAAFTPNLCVTACTVVTTGSGSPSAVVKSPVNGVIVAWHMREGSSANKYALRVVTPGSAETFTGAGTSAATSPAGAGLETFSTSLPVHADQMIGINLEAGAPIGFNGTIGSYAFFASPLADGETKKDEAITAGELAFNAEILPPPTIASLSTVTGPTAGGTSVAITGANFAEVKGVSFGSAPATYVVNSESQITATAPAGSAGSAPVTVTTVAGSAASPQAFTYVAPTCTVPKLKGKKLKAAKKKIRAALCKLGHVAKEKGVTVKSGKVVKQSPKAGSVRAEGSKVSVKLG